MNILHTTWLKLSGHLTATVHTLVAAIRGLAGMVSREPSKRQVTAELEALPGWILSDIGLERSDIVLVVDAGSGPTESSTVAGRTSAPIGAPTEAERAG